MAFRILLFLFTFWIVPVYPGANNSRCYEISRHETKGSEQQGDKACEAKKWRLARSFYAKALVTDATNAQLHFKYGAVLAMIASQDRWRALSLLGEMRESFETSLRLDPNQLESRWALVEYYLQVPGILGGSESKAAKYASELSRLSEIDGVLAKARIAVYFERFGQAEELYLKAINQFHSETARTKLIALYTKNNQPAKADALKKQVPKTSKTI